MTIARYPATPNITVAPGDVTVVGYSITYPAQYTGVHLQLQYSDTSRNVDRSICRHFDLDYAIVGDASNCTSTDGLKTDWYVLRINGTEDIDGQMVKCELSNNSDVGQVFDASCKEVMITVTNGKGSLIGTLPDSLMQQVHSSNLKFIHPRPRLNKCRS